MVHLQKVIKISMKFKEKNELNKNKSEFDTMKEIILAKIFELQKK